MIRGAITTLIVLFVLIEFLGCLDIALHGPSPKTVPRQQMKVLNDQANLSWRSHPEQRAVHWYANPSMLRSTSMDYRLSRAQHRAGTGSVFIDHHPD